MQFGEHKDVYVDFDLEINVDNSQVPISIAMCYPYSYSELQSYLECLDETMTNVPSVYYHREHLVNSYEGRRLDLLTISSNDKIENETEGLTHSVLFPSFNGVSTARKFKVEKRIALITARVHPGETPSSYAVQGVINMLTDPSSSVAEALRRMFVFKIVPMLNPDGVFRGHFRTDCLLQDLNRYYDEPTPQNHSPAFAICELMKYFNTNKRLWFFCDYHSHGLPRDCYLYGNFLRYTLQVESKTFAKLMEVNSPEFSYADCDFSFKNMGFKTGTKKKNKNIKTKIGCSRVVAFRSSLLIHSFTLEIGYHGMVRRGCKQMNLPINDPDDDDECPEELDSPTLNLADSPLTRTINPQEEEQVSPAQDANQFPPPFTPETFRAIGTSILDSLLDLFSRHPSSKLPTSAYKSLENIRTEIAQLTKKDYARTEKNLNNQSKNIHQIIEEIYSSTIQVGDTDGKCGFLDTTAAKVSMSGVSLSRTKCKKKTVSLSEKASFKTYRISHKSNVQSALPMDGSKFEERKPTPTQKFVIRESVEEARELQSVQSEHQQAVTQIKLKKGMATQPQPSPAIRGKSRDRIDMRWAENIQPHNRGMRSQDLRQPLSLPELIECQSSIKDYDIFSKREIKVEDSNQFRTKDFELRFVTPKLSGNQSKPRDTMDDNRKGRERAAAQAWASRAKHFLVDQGVPAFQNRRLTGGESISVKPPLHSLQSSNIQTPTLETTLQVAAKNQQLKSIDEVIINDRVLAALSKTGVVYCMKSVAKAVVSESRLKDDKQAKEKVSLNTICQILKKTREPNPPPAKSNNLTRLKKPNELQQLSITMKEVSGEMISVSTNKRAARKAINLV